MVFSTEKTEEWRGVLGFEGYYEVSSHGRIRSLPRIDRMGRLKGGNLLKPSRAGKYLHVRMTARGVSRTARVHTLVAESFIGPRLSGQEVRHADDDGTNNSLANICYGSSRDNSEDQRRNKGFRKALDHPNGRLTPEQVEIVKALRKGEVATWADSNGFSRGHIYNVRVGHRRKD